MSAKILSARQVCAGYGGREVLTDVDIDLMENEVLCMIGHNGAGKSTLVKALFGLLDLSKGRIEVDGVDGARRPGDMVRAGIAMVPEGRGIFPSLTVRETMMMSMRAAGTAKSEHKDRVDWVLEVLPPLKTFLDRRAGTLSGGQQQMVSIGRALLNRPRVLLMDEPSIGLAPKLFQDLLQPIRALQLERKMSILIVEQNVHEALRISDRVVVMKSGRMIWNGLPAELDSNAKLMELY
ncbi:MAG: ABC transporter ATP-binding protein [Rhizobiaceae bacterium]|nr:ABC transporter ATP-binding protein [Rhizobiaceae bacterium]